jgi:hypothetical protein
LDVPQSNLVIIGVPHLNIARILNPGMLTPPLDP